MATVGAVSKPASISGLSSIKVVTMIFFIVYSVGMVNPRPSLDESEPQTLLELALVSEGSVTSTSMIDEVDVPRSPEKRSSTQEGPSIERNDVNTSKDVNITPSSISESLYTSSSLENDAITEGENTKSFDEYFKPIGIDSRVADDVESIPLQLDVGQPIPSLFFIHINKTLQEMNNYPSLIEIQEGHFVGYGKNVNPDFALDQTVDTTNEDFLIEDCKIDNGFPSKLCASDGNTYDNLSHFYCVQHHDKDLQIVWDGPCNRTDWPTVLWSSEERMEVVNPEEIVKYFT